MKSFVEQFYNRLPRVKRSFLCNLALQVFKNHVPGGLKSPAELLGPQQTAPQLRSVRSGGFAPETGV